jgi:hypothetical protein
VFVSRVPPGGRDRLISNSIADAPAFHLQHFVGVLEVMSPAGLFNDLQLAANALLILSDAVVKRANLRALKVGDPTDNLRIRREQRTACHCLHCQ